MSSIKLTNNLQHPVLAYITSEDAGALLDTTLVAKNGRLRCHGVIILAGVSEYLDKRSIGDFTVLLPDFSVEELDELLCFCYAGRYNEKCVEIVSSLLTTFNLIGQSSAGPDRSSIGHPSSVAPDRSSIGHQSSVVAPARSSIGHQSSAVAPTKSSMCHQSSAAAPVRSSIGHQSSAAAPVRSSIGHQSSAAAPARSSSGHQSSAAAHDSRLIGQFSDSYSGKDISGGNIKAKVKVLMPVYKYTCAYCEDSFQYRQSLSRHLKEIHFKESDKYNCDLCKLEFTRKESMDRHLSSKSCLKSSSNIYQCKSCKKLFSEPSKLKTHVEKNCDRKYFCNICCKFFKKKCDFKSHEH